MLSPGISPVRAIVWEHWRLTRAEIAQRLGITIVVASTVMVWLGAAAPGEAVRRREANVALGLLILLNFPAWISIAKIKGGRFLDGYRPGFPLTLLYARPVGTATLVGVAMTYQAMLAATVYLLSALALRMAFDYPFPLLPVAAAIAAGVAGQLAGDWSTRSKVIQWVGSIAPVVAVGALAQFRWSSWPTSPRFSLANYALMATMALVSYGVAVLGVSRQRRGDARAVKPWTGSYETPEWLITLFRLPCPTSSATRAQVWFELRSSGLPILVVGAALAIVNPLLFTLTGSIDTLLSGAYARYVAVIVATFSVPAVLVLGGNAFGIRARQGKTYASAFDATQACGTARLAGLKALVRASCLVAALVAVGASIWISASLIPFDVLDDNDTFIEKSRSPLSGWMRAVERAVRAMSADELLALAVVASVVLVTWVALRASISALRARYPGRARVVTSLLVISGFVLVVIANARAQQREIGPPFFPFEVALTATNWVVAATSVLVTIYLFWRVFAERLLTVKQACGAALVWATFVAACVVLLRGAGVPLGALPVTDADVLTTAVLPLLATALAPWSLSRIRHL